MGNLREVELPDGTFVEYLVDGEGRRVGKGVDGVLERGWLWRGPLQPVAELDASGAVVKRFVYAEGANVPELMVTSTATYRLVKDHLGSVRYVVDVASGTVVQELAYDAWGRVLVDTSPGLQPFGFAGGLYDPDTGLVRFGAREYWATIGRWTAKDPIRFDGGDTNIYAYVGNDPVNAIDPRGESPWFPGIYGACVFGSYVLAEAAYPDWGDDKKRHCYASCMVARCSLNIDWAADGIGHGWEYASNWGTLDDEARKDIDANRAGIDRSRDFAEDCHDLCDDYDPKNPEPWCE